MRAIGRWVRHLIGSMVRGFLTLAIIAAILSGGIATLATRALPTGLTLAFVITISVISGLLGAFVMLAWRLTHISELAKLSHETAERLAHHDSKSGAAPALTSAQSENG
ncbi:MAG TPA: hypothetical protein VKQ36_07080 [Ktedonobacterales bacterium]|nr:hypothetical protein [Ktedonobacterales bacterium]